MGGYPDKNINNIETLPKTTKNEGVDPTTKMGDIIKLQNKGELPCSIQKQLKLKDFRKQNLAKMNGEGDVTNIINENKLKLDQLNIEKKLGNTFSFLKEQGYTSKDGFDKFAEYSVPVTRPRVTIEQQMYHLWKGNYHNTAQKEVSHRIRRACPQTGYYHEKRQRHP